jgi:hypothetical protein
MEELYIVGLESTMDIVKALVQNGYVVKTTIFAQDEEDDEDTDIFDGLLDNTVYCIMYEVQTEQ